MIAGWWARPEISQQDIIAHYLSPQSQLMASARDRGTQNAFLWVINQFLRRSDLLDMKIIQVWRKNICGQLINRQQSHSSDFCSVLGRIIRTNTAAREPENITTALQMTNSGTGINISRTKPQARMFSLASNYKFIKLDLVLLDPLGKHSFLSAMVFKQHLTGFSCMDVKRLGGSFLKFEFQWRKTL